MSQHECKILTDTGEFYATYDTTLDQFVTPAVISTDALMGFEECTTVGGKNVFDLRRATLEKIEALIVKLESGRSLTVPEAGMVENFERFLKGTVAMAHDHPEISDKVVEDWARELGLTKRFPDHSPREIVTDCGMFPAFQKKATNARLPRQHRATHGSRPKVGQNKIAGRYVRAMANIANIFGPNRASPNEILDRFYD